MTTHAAISGHLRPNVTNPYVRAGRHRPAKPEANPRRALTRRPVGARSPGEHDRPPPSSRTPCPTASTPPRLWSTQSTGSGASQASRCQGKRGSGEGVRVTTGASKANGRPTWPGRHDSTPSSSRLSASASNAATTPRRQPSLRAFRQEPTESGHGSEERRKPTRSPFTGCSFLPSNARAHDASPTSCRWCGPATPRIERRPRPRPGYSSAPAPNASAL